MSSTINASASAPGSLSWETAFAKFRSLSPDIQAGLRSYAVDSLVRAGFEEVGSSDISHNLFAEYRRANGDWMAVVVAFVNES